MPFPSVTNAFRPAASRMPGDVTDSSIRSIGAHPHGPGKARGAGFRAVFTALLAAWLALAAGCNRTPPEQALRETIARMEAAAEARDTDALAAHLADDFGGPEGMDRDTFRRFLALLWLRNRDVGVTLGPLEVELMGERARVRFTAAARGGAGLLPDSAELYEVRTGWRLEGGEWKLIAAEWEPVLR